MSFAHVARVKRLYLQGLRELRNRHYKPYKFHVMADFYRASFEENKHLTNPKQIDEILKEGEHCLYLYRHPEPMRCIHDPNSSSFQRFVILPEGILNQHDDDKTVFIG